VDALYLIFSKKYQLPLSGLVTTLLMVMLNAICFLPLMNQCDIQFSHLSRIDWTLLVLMTFSLMGFYIFWLKAAQVANASTIAISTALSPIITVILSWYFLDEKLQLLGILGMALIIMALFLQKQWVPKFSIRLLSRNINRR
jgi:drug/metabolite transporter (DMT)-like permease